MFQGLVTCIMDLIAVQFLEIVCLHCRYTLSGSNCEHHQFILGPKSLAVEQSASINSACGNEEGLRAEEDVHER